MEEYLEDEEIDVKKEKEWKHISEVAEETLEYVDKRRKGLIKSLKTGYPKLDESGIDGWEWGSTIALCARPGVGKTAASSCMIRGCFNPMINPQDFELLDMTWEMAPRVLMLRELSAQMEKSYKYIVSADKNKLTDSEMDFLERKIKGEFSNLPIYYVEKPKTPKEFAKVVRKFRDRADRKKKKLLVRVDHTILGKIGKEDKNQVDMLYNLLGAANEIKKEDNMTTFLFLSQLKREFEQRQENATSKAYPNMADVFGSDSVSMYSESIIILNKPSRYGINYYGTRPHGREVNPYHIFFHIVKARNATPDLIITFAERFSEMMLEEL